MLQIEEIRQMLRRHLPHLREEFHVDVLGVFGSYVRGEQTDKSDLDVLVTFSRTPLFLTYRVFRNTSRGR